MLQTQTLDTDLSRLAGRTGCMSWWSLNFECLNLWWCAIWPLDLVPVTELPYHPAVEAPGAPRRLPVDEISDVTSADLLPLLQLEFDRASRPKLLFCGFCRILAPSCRPWCLGRPDPSGLVIGLRHGRPVYPPAAAADEIQHQQYRSPLSQIWFQSYLSGRSHHGPYLFGVRRTGGIRVRADVILCSTPRGPDLADWKLRFVAASLRRWHAGIYGSCPPAAVDSLSLRVSECADAISTWMKSNRLQLSPVYRRVR